MSSNNYNTPKQTVFTYKQTEINNMQLLYTIATITVTKHTVLHRQFATKRQQAAALYRDATS